MKSKYYKAQGCLVCGKTSPKSLVLKKHAVSQSDYNIYKYLQVQL